MNAGKVTQTFRWVILTGALITITIGVLASAEPEGTSRLVSVQQLPVNMDVCTTWDEPTAPDANLISSSQEQNLFSALQQEPAATQDAASGNDSSPVLMAEAQEEENTRSPREALPANVPGARLPVRKILDTRPAYNSVGVNEKTGEVILQDNNLQEIAVFDRLTPTPKGENELSQPKRLITGNKTLLSFNNGLYVDPANGDFYSVQSDTGDRIFHFAANSNGNVAPISFVHSPHRGYNIAADEGKGELFVTVEYTPRVVVYPKTAHGEQLWSRKIEGDDTGLDEPHGIAVDEKDQLLFVNTWGGHSNFQVLGTGKYFPPAIKVYPLDANGNVKPIRVITGDKTQLDWPGGMKYNPDSGDLYIANDVGQSVLVFANVGSSKTQGDIAPARVIHGPSTELMNPTGLAIDRTNQELWVTNLGNSTATVYPLMADGDVSPLRMIRSAPYGAKGPNFGRTSAVAYDSIRQDYLVPNCVNHPQIAVFARRATVDSPYLRSIEGQKTLMSRTMHDIAYDAIHDEIIVTGPLTQSILTFRGAANGEEAPLRVIQGDKTLIKAKGAQDKVAIDPVHNEYYVISADQRVLTFDRQAKGNVAPKRILSGPHTMLSVGRQTTLEDVTTISTYGSQDGPRIRIDSAHNLLFVPSESKARGGSGGPMLVFDRTASGDTAPIAFVNSPGGDFELYPPESRIITYAKGSFQIWNYPAKGETAQAPFKVIPAPLGEHAGAAIALDPLHKEVIVATAGANSILTFFVPELFDHETPADKLTSSTSPEPNPKLQ